MCTRLFVFLLPCARMPCMCKCMGKQAHSAVHAHRMHYWHTLLKHAHSAKSHTLLVLYFTWLEHLPPVCLPPFRKTWPASTINCCCCCACVCARIHAASGSHHKRLLNMLYRTFSIDRSLSLCAHRQHADTLQDQALNTAGPSSCSRTTTTTTTCVPAPRGEGLPAALPL